MNLQGHKNDTGESRPDQGQSWLGSGLYIMLKFFPTAQISSIMLNIMHIIIVLSMPTNIL